MKRENSFLFYVMMQLYKNERGQDNKGMKGEYMQEQAKQQLIPVKVYRTDERVMIAAPMAGLEPENIRVEVTKDGRLILQGDERALLKEVKELLIDEWSVGAYHRELALPSSSQCGVCQHLLWQWRADGHAAY